MILRPSILAAALAFASAAWNTGHANDMHEGQAIFEKSFSAKDSQSFNADSCVACHRLGGVGGAGDAQFNARSVAIEYLQVPVNAPATTISHFVGTLNQNLREDGLSRNSGAFTTVTPLPHFGGSAEEQSQRTMLMDKVQGTRSEAGGPATHEDLALELAQEIHHELVVGGGRFSLTARMFHRNTPALFGVGLIDAITDEQILQQAALQQLHPQVSGRPATLRDGGIGRFGWRANVATLEDFARQACEVELGMTVELEQVPRLSAPADISASELQSLSAFMKSLPAPVPVLPSDAETLDTVLRGEQLFEKTGCSVCHVPSMGLAEHIYSDMLLHDMGEDLLGPIAADPFVTSTRELDRSPRQIRRPVRGYHGSAVTIPAETSSAESVGWKLAKSKRLRGFKTLTQPYRILPERVEIVQSDPQRDLVRTRGTSPVPAQTSKSLRKNIRVTHVNQEWRTAPLWGLRDSAPYMHDGRAANVDEAIRMHGGESNYSRQQYASLEPHERAALLTFLATLAAPAKANPASDL